MVGTTQAGDDDELGMGEELSDLRGCFEPVEARHVHVGHDHVGSQPARELDRLDSVDRVPDDDDPGMALQDRDQQLGIAPIVLGDEHAERTGGRRVVLRHRLRL